jgi:hypothetical protein
LINKKHQEGFLKKLAVAVLALSFLGCATPQSPVNGFWYTDAQGGIGATSIPMGAAKGEACATSILGIIGTGDASIKTAAASAGIARVSSVDYTSFGILGLYGKYCTVVYGFKGKGMARAKAAPPKAAAPAAAEESDDDF